MRKLTKLLLQKKLFRLVQREKLILLVLLFFSLISYGRLLQMNFWQDDNALVFKFTHISEDAGYLGKGIFGEGAYRYTVTPYYPIYKLFGYNPEPFFALALVFYIVSVYVVYFFFKFLFKDRFKAALAAVLYGCGYIASDGFIRLFNSVLASTSVILSCATLALFYANHRYKKFPFYLLSILTYYFAVDIGYIRTHYLFFIIVISELVFSFDEKKSFKNKIFGFLFSLITVLPFAIIFYKFYIEGGDERSSQVKVLLLSLLKGEFYNTYSFFSTFGNMILANQFFYTLNTFIRENFHLIITEKRFVTFLIVVLFAFLFALIRQKIISKIQAFLYFIFLAILLFSSINIFSNPSLIGGVNERVYVFLGIFLFCLGLIFITFVREKKIAMILFAWIVLNLAAYGAYIPIYAYPSDNRYLLHSFIPLVGFLTLCTFDMFSKLKSTRYKYLPFVIIAIWAVINLYSGYELQNQIIEHRAEPSKRFYQQLFSFYPSFKKGSIFYFYIPQKPFAQEHFNAAFSVAQMPDQTAIAWRYGIDRYDLKITNSYDDLIKNIKEDRTPLNKVYAFIADPDTLINVTDQTRNLLKKGSISDKIVDLSISDSIKSQDMAHVLEKGSIVINDITLSALADTKVTLNLAAYPLAVESKNFPLNSPDGSAAESFEKTKQFLSFKKWQEYFYETASASADTTWKQFEPMLVLDKDPETYWEADRIEWDDHNQGLNIELKDETEIAGIIYKNGPNSLTPSEFEVKVSSDGRNFVSVKSVQADLSKRDEIQKIIFKPVKAKFIQMLFHKTQYDDSPGISEVIALPSGFGDMDYKSYQNFSQNPFKNVRSQKDWTDLQDAFSYKGIIRISWKKDDAESFESTIKSNQEIAYTGQEQEINFTIPAGGQKIKSLIIEPINFPGEVIINKITFENSPLKNNE